MASPYLAYPSAPSLVKVQKEPVAPVDSYVFVGEQVTQLNERPTPPSRGPDAHVTQVRFANT